MTEGQQFALRVAEAAIIMGVVAAAQWWIVTPAPERRVAAKKYLGVEQCPEGRWHVHGFHYRCLCRWPETASLENRLTADRREGFRIATWISRRIGRGEDPR